MNVCIVGTGYVGLSTATGFAEHGHRIVCVDIDQKRVNDINAGMCPIFEPGMEAILKSAVKDGRLKATLDLKDAIKSSEVIYISVPTPCDDSGHIDTKYIDAASKSIASAMDGYKVVVVKSTVIPGTTEGVVGKNLEAAGKAPGKDFGLCMNPEFLREGHALEDFLKPDRIVVGSADQKAGDTVAKLYANFKAPPSPQARGAPAELDAPLLRTDIKTAEMIKYASNAFLATKITFSNEVGNICKNIGIDVYKVMEGVGLDSRIGPKFLRAGCGFGGSCFPKDVQALVAKGEDAGCEPALLKKVLEVNRQQRKLMVKQLASKIDLRGKKVAVLGLAFNPDTDDVRESAAMDTVEGLIKRGAAVVAYDPKAMENFKRFYPTIKYASSAKDALAGADACIIATDWDEFKKLGKEDFMAMKGKIIIEGRKTLDREKAGIRFEGVCW